METPYISSEKHHRAELLGAYCYLEMFSGAPTIWVIFFASGNSNTLQVTPQLMEPTKIDIWKEEEDLQSTWTQNVRQKIMQHPGTQKGIAIRFYK